MSGEFHDEDDQHNYNKSGSRLGQESLPGTRSRSALTSGAGSTITDEDEMIIMTTTSSNITNGTNEKTNLKLFKQHELDSLMENTLNKKQLAEDGRDRLSTGTPNISVTSSAVPNRKSPSEPISTMCSTMKHQIISR